MHRGLRAKVSGFFRVDQPVVGVDLSGEGVRVVVVEPLSSGVQIVALGAHEGRVGTGLAAGNPCGGELLSSAVRRLWRDLRIESPLVAVAVSARAALMRRVVVPYRSDASLREAVMHELARSVVLDDVAFDFEVLHELSDGRVEVLVACIKRARVQEVVEEFAGIGLRVVAVDLAPFALHSAFAAGHRESSRERAVVIVVGRGTAAAFISYCGVLEWFDEFSHEGDDGRVADDWGDLFARILKAVQQRGGEGRDAPPIGQVWVGGEVCGGELTLSACRQVFGVMCQEFDPLRGVPAKVGRSQDLLSRTVGFGVSFGLVLRHQVAVYRGAYHQLRGEHAL